ncbi:hypothetical protein BKG83_16220 [Mycobacteroides chelonae]|nr:hypothetical protein BKG83_16220 [Mycobacteroides chelonae]PKQ59381.1 hypothetical protein B5566_03890 [Mycobacterium sp. MHSD3]
MVTAVGDLIGTLSRGRSAWASVTEQLTKARAAADARVSRRDSWFGFEAARQLKGLPEQILTIPIGGHTQGHVGVVIDTGRTEQPRWLLHAGDTYLHHDEMNANPQCPPMLKYFQYLLEEDADIRHHNVRRLRELNDMQLINGHNLYYFDQAKIALTQQKGTNGH